MLYVMDGAAGDQFGARIATDGDTMLVSAPYKDQADQDVAGDVYAYRRLAGGWQFEQQLLTLTDGPCYGDQFGYANALKGNTAVIGAMYEDAGIPDAGVAHVFVREPGVG